MVPWTIRMRFARPAAAHGFTDCSAFGEYTDLPPHTIARSIFLEKRVDGGMATSPADRAR
jgi:hypothetical protein